MCSFPLSNVYRLSIRRYAYRRPEGTEGIRGREEINGRKGNGEEKREGEGQRTR